MSFLFLITSDGECREYYDDYWIFGEGAPLGPKKNDTNDYGIGDDEDGSGEGSGEEEGIVLKAHIFVIERLL